MSRYYKAYKKYKNLYLNLKNEGRYYEPIEHIEREHYYIKDDNELVEEIEPKYPFYFRDDYPYYSSDEQKYYDDTVNYYEYKEPIDMSRVIDIGSFGSYSRGKLDDNNSYRDDDFTDLDEPDKNKILRINNLDDFDNFTEKYGTINKYADINKKRGIEENIAIKWNKVSEDYRGLYINPGLEANRYNVAYFGDKLYSSWWKKDLEQLRRQINVLLFEDMEYMVDEPTSKISKPFKGETYEENDFDEKEYISLNESIDERKILRIKDIQDFDKFTNIYGELIKNKIEIDWESVIINYKGIYIDKDSNINKRMNRAFYEGKKYNSWAKGMKGKVYIFE